MKRKAKTPFDAKVFLATANGGRTISLYRKNQIIFSQGALADSVFYIQDGGVKVTVISFSRRDADEERPGSLKVSFPCLTLSSPASPFTGTSFAPM